jgi:hypothetical protein
MQVITIYVDAREESDLKRATELACDRIVDYDPTILILDTNVDEPTEEPNICRNR